ncbi:ribonuclease D [Parahaliea mediterranea]|uniref:Ribonuclease D n=1 Tax=Parahaliea mediterranea TaxID=651086 RepID=A0A939INS7_9GAMM|nr:ribonuclease D [Parahaliea mediterranea]MBN7798362.1 ribonuclease D [Parahaliea mediterranea]
MDWELIEDDATLHRVLAQYAGASAVAVDTEFMRRNTFYPKVALLQLCFEDKAWLVDPLAISDLAPLRALMAEPGLVKVLHSPSEDLEVFQRWLGELPRPLFDTQRAAALTGRDFGLGYRALVHDICDVDLPKDETRSDWLQRPLTEAQCQYAAQDVVYLLDVYRALRDESRAQGKLDWVLADGADAVNAQAGGPGSYYPRIKSAWKLDRHQLGALAALCQWREQTARNKDKPRSWIIDDQACLQIARGNPGDLAQLRAQVELPPAALRRYGEALLEVLSQQKAVPESDLPAPLPPPLSARQRDQGKKLKRRVRAIAAELNVAPEILLQSRDYEALVREARGESNGERPPHWRGWRDEVVIQPLRELLREGGA